MNNIYIGINANGDQFAVAKNSVTGILRKKDGTTIVFTTGGKVTLGFMTEDINTLADQIMTANGE